MNDQTQNDVSAKQFAITGNQPGPGPIRRFLNNYAARHCHPANIALHALGLPVTFLLPPVLVVWGWISGGGLWALALIAFVAGYALQFLGHALEGNDAGEVVLLKKWLGRPYQEFGPKRISS
jgi:hypothetical protein